LSEGKRKEKTKALDYKGDVKEPRQIWETASGQHNTNLTMATHYTTTKKKLQDRILRINYIKTPTTQQQHTSRYREKRDREDAITGQRAKWCTGYGWRRKRVE